MGRSQGSSLGASSIQLSITQYLALVILSHVYKLKIYCYLVDMSAPPQHKLQRRKTNSGESLKSEVYFRIVPRSISCNTSLPDSPIKLVLYLEKGMQILGKSTSFQLSSEKGSYQFDSGRNKFDFQIASQKNFNYTWAIYKVDQADFQERAASERFSIKDYYDRYQKQFSKTGEDLKINLKNFVINFKLFIQNAATNIMELVNVVLPQNQQDIAKALAGISKKPAETITTTKQKQSNQKQTEQHKRNEPESQIKIDVPPEENEVKRFSFAVENVQPEQGENEQKQEEQQRGQKQKNHKKIQNLHIEDPIQQESSVDESRKKAEIKNITTVQHQTGKLQDIVEDKQRQDMTTPMVYDSKFTKPGSINEAIAEAVSHQQHKYQTKQEQEPEQYPILESPAAPLKKSVELPSTKLRKSIAKVQAIEPVTANADNKFKKIVIIILFLILIAGILGTALSPNTEEDEDHAIPSKTKKKGKKGKSKE